MAGRLGILYSIFEGLRSKVVYSELAVLAVIAFVYSVVAGRVERSVITGPIVFVVVGFLVGPFGTGWIQPDLGNADLRLLADLTLALVLFIDAAGADLRVLKKHIRLPSRMLLVGLPGVIALGTFCAWLVFDELSLAEAAILATMLAATDAALGKGVVTNKAVPAKVREGLNSESGLNDGLCVPVLLLFIAIAEHGGEGTRSDLQFRDIEHAAPRIRLAQGRKPVDRFSHQKASSAARRRRSE